MKFTKTILALCAILTAASVSAFAQSAQSLSFINGANFYVSVKSTNSFAATNIYSKGFVVTNSTTYPYVSSYSPVWVTNTSAIADVSLWANRDGTPPLANISVDIYGTDPVQSTNIVTFNFATMPSNGSEHQPGLAATAAQNLFTFTATFNGTNDVVLATNVPQSFLQGNMRLRLLSVVSPTQGTTSGTNGYVSGVWFNGYKPE